LFCKTSLFYSIIVHIRSDGRSRFLPLPTFIYNTLIGTTASVTKISNGEDRKNLETISSAMHGRSVVNSVTNNQTAKDLHQSRPTNTPMPSKTVSRTTGPRSFGRMMALVGTGLLLLLLMAEGAVVMPKEEAAEGALWSEPVSSSPGRQGRVVGAGRAASAAAAEEGVVMMEDGHDTTTSRRYDFAAAAAAGAGAVVTAQDGSPLHEFPSRHETTAAEAEGDGIVLTENGTRTNEFSTPRRVNIKHSKKTTQSLAELSEQSGKPYYPTHPTLYLIRHANKRKGNDHTKARLCKAGRTRAQGLVELFNGYKYKYKGGYDPLRAKPDHLIVYMYKDPPYKVQRCLQTLGYIAKALGKTSKDPKYIHKVDYPKNQNKKGADKIRDLLGSTDGKHVVLAAWEHVNMHDLIHDLGLTHDQKSVLGTNYEQCKYRAHPKNDNKYGPEYPGNDDFDYVYTFEFADFKNHPHHPTKVTCHHQHITIPSKEFNDCAYNPHKKK